jgi:hypothetical protein
MVRVASLRAFNRGFRIVSLVKGQAERNGYARIVFLQLRADNLVLRGEFVAEASVDHRATV